MTNDKLLILSVQKINNKLKLDPPLYRRGVGGEAGVRTRAIQKRLKGVETISNEDAQNILPELMNDEMVNDEE